MKKLKNSFAILFPILAIACTDHSSKVLEKLPEQVEHSIPKYSSATDSQNLENTSQYVEDSIDYSDPLEDIYTEVINDSIQQYQIAKKHGELVDICVQAGMVAAAQLQAKNEVGYKEWKKIEKIDCNNYENEDISYFDE